MDLRAYVDVDWLAAPCVLASVVDVDLSDGEPPARDPRDDLVTDDVREAIDWARARTSHVVTRIPGVGERWAGSGPSPSTQLPELDPTAIAIVQAAAGAVTALRAGHPVDDRAAALPDADHHVALRRALTAERRDAVERLLALDRANLSQSTGADPDVEELPDGLLGPPRAGGWVPFVVRGDLLDGDADR